MSRWFRHYAGMMRDDKLVRAAMQSKQSVERVVWVWGAILESAAEVNDGGRYDFDPAEAAYFLRADLADVVAIQDALTATGRLAEGAVVHWCDRQYESDRSATRQAAYRERKRSPKSDADAGERSVDGSGDDGVTAASRHGDAPETETHTEPEKKVAAQPSLRGADRTQAERECREAAGLANSDAPGLEDFSPLWTMIALGYDLVKDVLPVLRACHAAGKHGRSWRYYVAAITEAKTANAKIPPKRADPPANPMRWTLRDSDQWDEDAAAYKAKYGRDPPTKPGLGGMGWHFDKPQVAA